MVHQVSSTTDNADYIYIAIFFGSSQVRVILGLYFRQARMKGKNVITLYNALTSEITEDARNSRSCDVKDVSQVQFTRSFVTSKDIFM